MQIRKTLAIGRAKSLSRADRAVLSVLPVARIVLSGLMVSLRSLLRLKGLDLRTFRWPTKKRNWVREVAVRRDKTDDGVPHRHLTEPIMNWASGAVSE